MRRRTGAVLMTLTFFVLSFSSVSAVRAEVILGWNFDGLTGTAALDDSYTWTTADGDTPGGYNDPRLETAALTATVTSGSSQDDFYRLSGFDLGNTAPGDIPSSHPRDVA